MKSLIMYTKKVKFIATGILMVSVLATSCHKKEKERGVAEDTRPTVTVDVNVAGGAEFGDFFTVSGRIEAEKSADISARLIGTLTRVPVRLGDAVKEGQVLATIGNADLQAKGAQADALILEAESGLRNAQRDLDRVQSLFDKQSATQKELDDITTHRDMMQAKLSQAVAMKEEVGAMLAYSVIKAPFSGTVTGKYVEEGDQASPGKPLFRVESGKTFLAEAMVPENYIGEVSRGEAVTVVLKTTGEELGGTVSEISSSSLQTGGQYVVRIDLDKKDVSDLNLMSGMYVNVRMPIQTRDEGADRITVDRAAIVTQGQLTGLYTISEQQTAVLRWVRLGRSFGNEVEVLSGLSAGEEYIVGSEGRLLNGVKVEKK